MYTTTLDEYDAWADLTDEDMLNLHFEDTIAASRGTFLPANWESVTPPF